MTSKSAEIKKYEKANELRRAAADFHKEHEDESGVLSLEDQKVYNAMIAGEETLRGGGLQTQRQLDRNPRATAGRKGEPLVDERGRIHRALGRDESFAEAVLENGERFGVSADQEKLVGDGLSVGNYVRACILGPQNSAERFALSESNATGGGYTVPSILSAMMIDHFRAKTVVIKAGAQTLPLDSAEHTFARLTGDPTATWRTELSEITESGPTFGGITFHPRSLAVLVKASRELLQDSPNIAQAIERSITAAVSVEVDRVALLGAAQGPEPTGLRYYEGLNELTGIGALTDYSDYVDAYKLIMDDNAPEPTAAIISNREWATLAKLEDSTGQPLQLPPAVSDLPFMATSAIPTNLGGGGNESISVVGHFPDLIIGMRSELQIETLKELFAGTHAVGFVAHLRLDIGVFHPVSFVRMLGITP